MNWSHEFKVGVFTVVAIIVIGYMFFVLTPDMFRRESTNEFYTIVENAAGIVTKTQVKTSGVIVGSVKNVALDKDLTRIDFTVRGDIKIPRGSEIALQEKGLLGDVFLEIFRADDKGEYIPPGGLIPPSKDQVTISKLVNIAGSIGRDIKEMTGSLSKVIGGEKGTSDLSTIFNDIKEVAANLKGMLEENRKGVKTFVDNLDETSVALREIVSGRKEDIIDTVENIRSVTDALRDVLRTENRERVDRIIASLDKAAVNIDRIAHKLDKGEGTLGRLISDDKVLTEVEGAVKDVRNLLAPAQRFHVFVDYHGEFKGDAQTQHYFNVLLKPRPDKFYLIGATDVNQAEKETISEDMDVIDHDRTEDGKNPRKMRERTYERRSLRLNLQYAKRWLFAQVRFGLFESTGGLASDFYLLNDKLRFTIEAYDWRRSPDRNVARVKTYVSILFFDRVYAMVGADELTKRHPVNGDRLHPEYFLAAGLTFSDEDLKGLFGIAASAL